MEKLTNNNYAHLRMFNDGLSLDLCIEPSNAFGHIFPPLALGAMIKISGIRDLKAKGVIVGKTILMHGLEYKRYSISEFGKSVFEE